MIKANERDVPVFLFFLINNLLLKRGSNVCGVCLNSLPSFSQPIVVEHLSFAVSVSHNIEMMMRRRRYRRANVA